MRKRFCAAICCVLLTVPVISGCGAEEPEILDGVRWGVEDPYGFMRESGLELFQQTLQPGENTLISPLSILGSLGMAACGARGETESQVVHIFGNGETSWSLTVHYDNYTDALPQGDRYRLALANSIWIKDDLEVNQVYVDNYCTKHYDAEVRQAPFDDSTTEEINRWVDEQTDGMIPVIINGISEDDRMYLINALAFDAEWDTIYNEAGVREGIFTASDGRKQDAEMMYSQEHVYLEDDNAVGFMKYYADEKYAFVALLPNEGTDVSEYVASLTAKWWSLTNLLEGAQEVTVDAAIPKFQCSYDVDLEDVLKEMGVEDAFDPKNADFSFITESEKLHISRVLHKTYIAVDERGTKAGAATAAEISTMSAPIPEETKTVYLDRPFLYMIIDCEDNVPLFVGTLDHLE